MASPSDDLLHLLITRVGALEKLIQELPTQRRLNEQLERLDTLLIQLSRHVNPTREEVTLLKRTNRALAREMQQLHVELGRKLV